MLVLASGALRPPPPIGVLGEGRLRSPENVRWDGAPERLILVFCAASESESLLEMFFFQDQDIKSLDSSHEIRFEDGLSHLVVGTSGRFVKKKTKYSFLFNISCHMKEIEYAAIYSGRTQSHMDVQ